MKAISARIRGATSELADMGEEYEDIAQGMSKYRDEIMAITNVTGRGGFDIMKDVSRGEYKDLYDIFVGLAGVWNQLSGTGQARLSEILGGTRQLQVVSSIMNNITDATGAYGDALMSTESLEKDYEKQLDSISGKLGVLKANFQDLSTTILDSSLIKTGVDFLSTLTKGLDSITGKFGAGGIVATALALKKVMPLMLGYFNLLKHSSFTLSGISKMTKGFWGGLGTAGKIGLVIDALFVLNSLLKAVTGHDIVGWINEWSKTAEEKLDNLNDEIRKTNDNIRQISREASKFATSYNQSIDRYAELFQRSGRLATKGELNDEEYAEFLSLQNQIAEMFPQIDLGIDSNGNHILALGGDVDALKEKYDALYEAQLRTYRSDIIKEYNENNITPEDIDKTVSPEIERYEALKEALTSIADSTKDAPYTLGIVSKELSDILERYEVKGKTYAIPYAGVRTEYSGENVEKLKANLGQELQVFDDHIDLLKGKRDEVVAATNQILVELLPTSYEFQKLPDELKGALLKVVSSIDLSSYLEDVGGEADGDVIYQMLLQSFVKPIVDSNLGEDVKSAIEGKLSKEDLASAFSDAFSKVSHFAEGENPFVKYFGETGNAITDVGQAMVAFVNLMIGSTKEMEDTSGETFEGLISGIVKVKTEYQELTDLISKFKSKGAEGLDKKQYEELIRILPDLAVEFRIYNEEIEAAKGDINELGAAHTKMLNTMTASAKAYINTRLADGFKNIAEAANKFGSQSYQAQHAMRELAEVAPDVINGLYNEETGMYNLGNASIYTANSILAVAQAQAKIEFSNLNSQLLALQETFGATSRSALVTAATISLALSATGSSGSGGPYSELPSPEEAQNILDIDAALKKAEETYSKLMSMDIPGPGGGGSAKTYAEQVKEAFDALNQSLENHVALQEDAFEKSKDVLSASGMREALARQVSYYTSMQREAKRAADAVRQYYIKTGLSEQAAEQKKEVQELEKAYVDATKKVEDATDRMTQAIVEAFSSSVDEMQDVYKTLHDAADEYATTGYITVDTFQAIISQGVEYLALLKDENGQLVINEETVRKLIAARVEQMTVETALSYVEALQAAKMTGNIEKLDQLLHATRDTTSATWGLVYASLELVGLTEDQKTAALDVINSLRALSQTAIDSIGKDAKKTENILKDMKKGVNDLLKYVMDMIKKNVELQIDAIEEQKKKISEVIDLKKKSLEMDRDEAKYQDKIAEITGKLAANQSRIDALSLVGTREAEAEKTKLLEEQQELQKELNDLQADNALEQQKDSLDQMEQEYHDEKDAEIKDLEESISSKQKIYDAAIKWIEDNWNNLHEKLLSWNEQHGDAIASDITKAWEAALEAAKKYGSFTESIKGVDQDLDGVGQGTHDELGPKPDYKPDFTDEDAIRAIVSKMKYNSKNWFAFSEEEQKLANQRNKELAAHLSQYGVEARFDPATGIWYDQYGNELYKKYASYHTGGIVGDNHPNANEQFALLKNKEWVLSENMVGNLTNGMKVIGKVSNLINGVFGGRPNYALQGAYAPAERVLSSITNSSDNHGINITIGDTTITGADSSTLRSHQRISRDFLNELARQLGVKW